MKFFTFLLLPSRFLLADLTAPLEEELNLSSTKAVYDGNTLNLEGSISLRHSLGTLSSEEAFLQKQENKAELPFSLIHLKKEVFITLQNKATLSCESAELDFNTLQGHLQSDEQKKVTYNDLIKTADATISPLQICSKVIDLIFTKSDEKNSEVQYSIDHLIAKKEVVITYAKDFTLKADEATYEKLPGNGAAGLIKAYPTVPENLCLLSFKDNFIETPKIEINVEKKLLNLQNPKGSLKGSLFSQKENGEIFFSAKELDWDYQKGLLTLHKDITIKEESFGSLLADKELLIEQDLSQKTNQIKAIYVNGPSVLSQKDATLISSGQLHLDGEKRQIIAISPKNKQLLYIDSKMQLEANQALLEYTESSQDISSLTLKGNVKIKTTDLEKKPKYGLADRLIYSPETKTLILLANTGKKVLFQDLEDEISMSAQEVHLTQNPTTGKMDIKGIGNLKLFLSGEELTLLQNSLNQETQAHE